MKLKILFMFAVAITMAGFKAHAAEKTCLNRSQIIVTLQKMATDSGYPYLIKLSDSSRVTGIMGAVSWEDLNDVSNFRRAGLSLRPDDIRYVHTVNELVGVIQWGLCKSTR